MNKNETHRKPLETNQYPCYDNPIKNLRRCQCGRVTFLDFPCSFCGSSVNESVFVPAQRADSRFKTGMMLRAVIGGLLLVLAGLVLYNRFVAVICGFIALGVVMNTSRQFRRIDKSDRLFFWLFHTDKRILFQKKEIPVLTSKHLEPLMDAWYMDMDYLERLSLNGQWEDALYGARRLFGVYRNPRLSRLMYRSLMHISPDGREYFELNEICAHVDADEIAFEDMASSLRMIERAVNESCCQQWDNVKKVFASLLRRYLVAISQRRNLHSYSEVLGEELFLYCGGQLIRLQNGRVSEEFPRDSEGEKNFMARLKVEVTRHRQDFIDNGTWYPLLSLVRESNMTDADKTYQKLDACFIRGKEYSGINSNIGRSALRDKRLDVNHFHPDQKRIFTEILGYWVVDENGNYYTESSDPVLRQLASESHRIKIAEAMRTEEKNGVCVESSQNEGADFEERSVSVKHDTGNYPDLNDLESILTHHADS